MTSFFYIWCVPYVCSLANKYRIINKVLLGKINENIIKSVLNTLKQDTYNKMMIKEMLK